MPPSGRPAFSCATMLEVLSALNHKFCCMMPQGRHLVRAPMAGPPAVAPRLCVSTAAPWQYAALHHADSRVLYGADIRVVKAAAMLPGLDFAVQVPCRWPMSIWTFAAWQVCSQQAADVERHMHAGSLLQQLEPCSGHHSALCWDRMTSLPYQLACMTGACCMVSERLSVRAAALSS